MRKVKRHWTDRLLEGIAPRVAARRLQARQFLAMTEGGYKGGRRDRRPTRNWRPPESSADAAILPDLPDLRARSRDNARNMPLATGAIATNVTSVVGDGLVLQSTIDREALGLSEEQAEAWQRSAEREFHIASKTADWTRVQCFEELQALAFRSTLESGDVFAVRRFRRDAGDTYGTKLMLIEADRVSNPNRRQDTDQITAGIEFDGNGVPLACHVSDKHPGGQRVAGMNWARVPLRSNDGRPLVLHLYDRLRPEQTRGVPYLAPIIESVKQLGDYTDAEATAAVNSAMLFAFEKLPAAVDEEGNPVVGQREASDADNEVTLEDGALITLDPGSDIVVQAPGRPNSEFGNFYLAFLRAIGVALELPLEVLIKHFTASYSASRAALEMAWQFFRCRRTWLARRFCQPFYEWVLEEAVAFGRINAPGFFEDELIRQAWCGAMWIGPSRWSLDPGKDATADETDMRTGVKTLAQCIIERGGGDPDQKHQQRAREVNRRVRDKLEAPVGAAKPSAAEEPAPERDEDEEEEE